MNALPKITENIRRFDTPVGSPIGSLARFHAQNTTDIPNTQNPKPHNFGLEGKEKTYEDGLAEGRSQALSQESGHGANIAKMLRQLHLARQQIEVSHGRAIIAVLRAVLPSLARCNALTEIRDFIVKTSAQAMQGRVTIHAPPQLQKDLLAIMDTLKDPGEAQSAEPDFTIEINEKISANKVRATWQSGGGEIDIDGAVQACLDLLENNYSGENDGKSRATK